MSGADAADALTPDAALGIGIVGTSAPGHYTDADHAAVATVLAEQARLRKSRAWIARACRTSNSTVSQVLSGKYPSPPTELLERMLQALSVEAERLGDGTPGYVEGSVHKLVFVVCDRTRKHGNMGVIVGYPGIGKTYSLREYAKRKPATLLVESNPQMTAGNLLRDLLKQLRLPIPSGVDDKFVEVVNALSGTMHLIIVDEAHSLTANALHYVRRIRDKAGVGVVLCDSERLNGLLQPEHGQFDQIRSRVGIWPPTIESITRDDMDDLARVTLRNKDGSQIDLSDDVLDSLWAHCKGSARVLTEILGNALRDYGINQGLAITPKLIASIAKTVVSLRKAGER